MNDNCNGHFKSGRNRPLFYNLGRIHCTVCGQYTDEQPCPYPEGLPAIEIELNVPSGGLVIDNDLRDKFRIVGYYNVNEDIGLLKTTRKYAEVGMAHAFVGNTCPSVWKGSKESKYDFLIGTGSRCPLKGYRRVADIITDLWWYSIVDADEYERRYSSKAKNIVKCKPGVYKFCHVYHQLDGKKEGIYTYIKWIRPPDPIMDFKSEWNNLNFTVGQVVADKMALWPDLYENIQNVLNYLFCVVGSGDMYHPNGWWNNNPDISPDLVDLDIPVLDKKYKWYPLSNSSMLGFLAEIEPEWFLRIEKPWIRGNKSFIAAAFNVLRSIILYGSEGSVKEQDSNLRFAKRCFRILIKKYPESVPENCVNLLKGKNVE